MTVKGKAEPNFTAEMFFLDAHSPGYGWQFWQGETLVFQGGAIGTEQEAIDNFESGFADKYPDAGEWEWQNVEDPYECCSAKGEMGKLNLSWTLIEEVLSAQSEFVCWDDAVAIDELESKFKFELKFRALLKAFAASNGLIPQRWNNGSITWVENPVAVPCAYCGATDMLIADAGIEFPGSDKYAIQIVCGCGNAGPHAANEQDAIQNWNQVNAGQSKS